LQVLYKEFSSLAEACLQFAWETLGCPELAVIGLGKFGGREIGFGSDLDVIFVGEPFEAAQQWMEFMNQHLAEGILFQMDLRLRPHGEGVLSLPMDVYREYYEKSAQLWEIQSLCKARFAGGNRHLSENFFNQIKPIWEKQTNRPDFKELILDMRTRIEKGRCKSGNPDLEFKTGEGGLMDIEFAMQAWQMKRHIFQHDIFTVISEWGKSNPECAQLLKEIYLHFRTIETWLRFDLNQSISHLPQQPNQLEILAKRMGFSSKDTFMEDLRKKRLKVREIFNQIFETL
jgi:glutamate-ammonia-ligase adenylyltransferase